MLELFESRIARNNKATSNATFLEIMKENWRQVRHLDSMRILLTVAYAALFAATLAYIVYKALNLSSPQTILIFVPLLAVSVIWVLVTLRINADINNYLCAIRNAFTEGKIAISEKDYWFRFMGTPRSMGEGIDRWFTVGNCLIFFYAVGGIGAVTVMLISAV